VITTVDFNADSMASIPATDVVKILILEKNEYVNNAFESYDKQYFSKLNTQQFIAVVRCRILALLNQLFGTLNRKWMTNTEKANSTRICKKIIDFRTRIREGDINILQECSDIIQVELDTMKLTVVDTQKVYDRTRVEVENKIKGY
jgi:hypothetical protein